MEEGILQLAAAHGGPKWTVWDWIWLGYNNGGLRHVSEICLGYISVCTYIFIYIYICIYK